MSFSSRLSPSFWSALLFGFVLLCGAPSPSWCQDFDPAATYPVKGAQLNKLQQDLTTAKSELATSEIKNAQLAKDSESKAKALAELQAQLTTVSESFRKSQNEALWTMIEVGTVAAVVGLVVGHVWR